jgi:hypothetical protein
MLEINNVFVAILVPEVLRKPFRACELLIMRSHNPRNVFHAMPDACAQKSKGEVSVVYCWLLTQTGTTERNHLARVTRTGIFLRAFLGHWFLYLFTSPVGLLHYQGHSSVRMQGW